MPTLTTHYRSLAMSTVLASGIIGPEFLLDYGWHMMVQAAVSDGQGGRLFLTPANEDSDATLAGWFEDQQGAPNIAVTMLFYITQAKSGRSGRRLMWVCTKCTRSCATLYAPVVRLVDGSSGVVDWRCRKCYGLQYPRE
jgi:hypothetical protein